jgi:hypothetical protein
MLNGFDKALLDLRNAPVRVTAPTIDHAEPFGCTSVLLHFAKGAILRADYWRLIKDGKAGISSFDHQQKYGLPAPIDAIAEMQSQLHEKPVTDARWDTETGDLLFEFGGDTKLQVFNFSSYELWEMKFPDGSVEYSNYAI